MGLLELSRRLLPIAAAAGWMIAWSSCFALEGASARMPDSAHPAAHECRPDNDTSAPHAADAASTGIARSYFSRYAAIPDPVVQSVKTGYQTPVPNTKCRDLLDAIVALDSRRWIAHQYAHGSMRDATLARSGDAVEVTGVFDYTEPTDRKVWVTARFIGGRLSCIRYWDTSRCENHLGKYAEKRSRGGRD